MTIAIAKGEKQLIMVALSRAEIDQILNHVLLGAHSKNYAPFPSDLMVTVCHAETEQDFRDEMRSSDVYELLTFAVPLRLT